MEKFKVALANAPDAVAAVKDIKEQLKSIDACMILFFASSIYTAETVSREMARAFSEIPTVGCTTAGEMISDKMGQNSIVAMAWDKSMLKDLKIEVLENIKTDHQVVAKAFKSFEKSLGTPMSQLDSSRYVGLIMIDGLSGCEETLNDQVGNLTNVSFVGGSAGDDFHFKHTYVMLNGRAYTEAAVLVLMEPTNGFSILKTQSFSTTSKKLTPTKVDEKRRAVLEFNHKPATEAYAEVLGIPENELVKRIGEYPLGLVFDENNFFVRSPQQIEDKSVIFYCSIKEGLELTILQSGNIVADTKKDFEQAKQKLGTVQAVIDFNCCLRTSELAQKNQQKAYAELFHLIPTVGFATYGESYIGHINQTSTMLLLK